MSAPGSLDRLALVGASFRTLGFERLGELVLPPAERPAVVPALAAALGADELVYVATCNRVECYVALGSSSGADELVARLEVFFARRGLSLARDELVVRMGRAALEHLLRVAAALDSLVIGETEIVGQVRRASEQADALGLLGDRLRGPFERASACARRVRQALEAGRLPASAADLALEKIARHFGDDGPRVSVLVGTGPMTRKVAAALEGRPGERIFVNRTLAGAEGLAARFGGRALSLEAFQQAPPPWLDLVFTATSAREPVVRPDQLRPALAARRAEGLERPLIICDLGVPRDVDPACDALDGALVIALEHMEALARARAERQDGLARAVGIVEEELERLVREERFRAIAAESARALLAGRLAHLSPGDRDAVLRLARGLGSRLARQPGEQARGGRPHAGQQDGVGRADREPTLSPS